MYSQNNERDENQIINAEKMPLFLVKLWNIVEDTAYSNIIRWDEVYNFNYNMQKLSYILLEWLQFPYYGPLFLLQVNILNV